MAGAARRWRAAVKPPTRGDAHWRATSVAEPHYLSYLRHTKDSAAVGKKVWMRNGNPYW